MLSVSTVYYLVGKISETDNPLPTLLSSEFSNVNGFWSSNTRKTRRHWSSVGAGLGRLQLQVKTLGYLLFVITSSIVSSIVGTKFFTHTIRNKKMTKKRMEDTVQHVRYGN